MSNRVYVKRVHTTRRYKVIGELNPESLRKFKKGGTTYNKLDKSRIMLKIKVKDVHGR